jgi:hypothetical protein
VAILVKRRRLLWAGLLLCGLGLVAAYLALPLVTAMLVKDFLRQQGYRQVALQLGYPGWRRLQVPFFSLQKHLDNELLTVTAHHSRLEYDFGALLAGRIERVIIPRALVSLHGRPGPDGRLCAPSTAASGPGLWAGVTVGHLLRPAPALPWRELTVEHLQWFRECASEPLREMMMTATVHSAGETLQGSFRLQGSGKETYRLLLSMPGKGSFEATLAAESSESSPLLIVRSHLSPQSSGLQLHGQASIDFAPLAPLLALLLPTGLDAQGVAGRVEATWTATAPPGMSLATAWQDPGAVFSATVAGTLQLATWPGIGEQLSLRLQGSVSGNASRLAWTVHQDSRLGVELAPIPLPDTLQWLIPQQDRRLVVECPEPITGTVQFANPPLQFTVEGPVRAQYGTEQSAAQVEVVLQRLTRAQPLTAEGTYRLQGKAARVALPGLVGQGLRWDLRGTLALAPQQAQGSVEPGSFLQASGLGTVTEAAVPFAVQGGRLAVTVSLPWLAVVRPDTRFLPLENATIILEDVSGRYDNVLVHGLSTALHLQTTAAGTLAMPGPAQVRIAAVQTGIEITAVSGTLHLGWQPPGTLAWVECRELQAALLGAQVRSAGLRYEMAQPQHTLDIQVEQLDLQTLLNLEQQQGLQGRGILDGRVPLRLTQTGVRVQDGKFTARPPGGVIRYRPATAPALEEAQSHFVLQVLENFHYHTLELEVQYEEDGTLQLAVRLAGNNPDWQQGRPIHVNLRIEENIPALLKSLRVVQGIQKSLEEKFRRP